MLWQRQRSPEIDHDERHALVGTLRTFRAAFDELRSGIVLLDTELRATFINRAFRKMWRLADEQADSDPPFVALMYHGRDIRAYAMPPREVDAYIAERVARVRAGDPRPIDLRLASGEVVRFQCTVLADGGRLLTYTYVTEMVREADELDLLRAALDHLAPGVLLLDRNLNARFMNKAVRRLWNVDEREAAAQPSFAHLLHRARTNGAYAIPDGQLDGFVAERVAQVRAGDSIPRDLQLEDGRVLRAQCTVLPDGGRMLTYTDVSDLTRRIEELQRLTILEPATDLSNGQHFHARLDAEWDRFRRYQRPLSVVLLDIDRLKAVNDRYGREAGDRVVAHVVDVCARDRRGSDVVARVGGDELALLLPETDLDQAEAVAERVRQGIAEHSGTIRDVAVPLTVSIGLAAATLSMPGAGALMRAAEQALARAKTNGRNLTRRAEIPMSDDYERAAE